MPFCYGEKIAERFQHFGVQAIVTPASGSATLAHRIALHLKELTGHDLPVVSMEWIDEVQSFNFREESARKICGRLSLIVDDELERSRMERIIYAMQKVGANLYAIGVISNPAGITAAEIIGLRRALLLVSLTNGARSIQQDVTCGLCV